MATKIPTPIKVAFVPTRYFKTTRHYETIDNLLLSSEITSKINISKDQGFAKSDPDYWLKFRELKKWGDNATGLFKTGTPMYYSGDLHNKRDTIICHFKSNGNLIIYLFRNYYTRQVNQLIQFIETKKRRHETVS